MSGTKSSSRGSSVKKDGSFRYATRLLTSEKGKHNNNSSKETNSTKASELKSLLKSEGLKAAKYAPNSKVAVKKSNKKSIVTRESRRRANTDDDHETVVIVKKRSSSVSVVKQTVKTVTVSKVTRSYSTAVQLSSDEETNSDESEAEETKKKYKRKKKNVKQLTSKAKSNKKISKKAAKKAKAIKLLCDKLSAPKGKVINPVRELRPRFPYSILQELPTARAHRMASLNALAKVHVLYENEGRNVGENLNDADESSLIEFLDENSDDDDTDVPEIEKESKPPVNTNVKKNDKVKNNDKEKQKNVKKEKVPKLKAKRGKKRKLPDVEIIDTKICKRMASLNAQAILAASYLQEPKPKRVKKAPKSSPDFESKEVMACDIIIKTEIEDDVTIIETQQGMDDIEQQNESSNILPEQMNKTEFSFNKSTTIKNSTPESPKKKKPTESERVTIENNSTEKSFSSSRQCSIENSVVASSATSTKVGVTQYTEVRKVQINTHKDAEEKAGSKSERKIEQIISNDDGAITQTYHYQSKSKNESYCVQMQTTYKSASKNLPPSSQPPSDGIHPFNDSILPSNQHYYACNSMLPPQAYQLNSNLGPVSSVVAMDHRLPRQFGSSAFTVPHYRHPQPMQFPPNDYGYYQPAGPLIQPVQDNYTIHKPVPYHPQPNPHQPPQRPQQPPQHEGFQTFESLQTHPQNSSLPSVSPPILSQQKSVKHIGSSSSENISSPQSVKYQLDSKSKGLNHTNNNNSFTSQNFENYSQSKPATPPFKQFSSSVESAKSRNLSHSSNSSSFDPQISKNISQPPSSSPEFERHVSVKETKARNVNRNNSFGPSNSDTSNSSFPQTIRHKSGDAKSRNGSSFSTPNSKNSSQVRPSSPKFMKHQSAGDDKSRNNSSVDVQNSEIHSQHEPSSPEFMRHQSAGDTKYRNDISYSPSNSKNPSQAKLPSPHLMTRQRADDEKSRNSNSLGPLNSESPSFTRPSSPQFMRHQPAENEKSNNNNVYSPLNSEKQPFQQTSSSSQFMRRQHVGDVKSRNSNSFGPQNSENPLHTGPSSPQLIRQQPSENEKCKNNGFAPINSKNQPLQQRQSSPQFRRRQCIEDVKSRNNNPFDPQHSENPLQCRSASPQIMRQPIEEEKSRSLSRTHSSSSFGLPNAENNPQPRPSSPQFMRHQSIEDARSRNLSHTNNGLSFSQPSKHVRSPVMPTLYSSQQTFRSYQTQKRVPSSFRSYNLPCERKEGHTSRPGSYDSSSSFTSSESNISKNRLQESHHSRNISSVLELKKEVSPPGDHYRNINNPENFNERNYGFKHQHGMSNMYQSSNVCNPNNSSAICNPGSSSNMHQPNLSSNIPNSNPYSNIYEANPTSGMCGPINPQHSNSPNFLPYYHNAEKDVQNIGGYPSRPPSIEIVEDNHRDTKTYIQLEVPKNSHREKIVVVDVEDDEIEKKHVISKNCEKIIPPFDKFPHKIEPEKKSNIINVENSKHNISDTHDSMNPTDFSIKVEKIENTNSENVSNLSQSNLPLQNETHKDKIEKVDTEKSKAEKVNIDSPDVMVIEVKKKKESAVVRRARLHGKQRTFRDCYNRPLAQLSKTKKQDEDLNVPEKHLTKKFQPLVSLPRIVLPKVEKIHLHGWSWEGIPYKKQVYISNDDPPSIRQCYPSIKHAEGDVICVKDCVFLRSGPKKNDIPFVAKVTALWDNPANGEMTMSLLWYYRPEHTEISKKIQSVEDEVFASKHRDINSVACIEDKCFVLTYSEYCRYRKQLKMLEDNSIPGTTMVPQGIEYCRKNRLPPPNVFTDIVLFCRKVYDYRHKRLLKNPG